jgi:N-methylhydantoinase B
MTETTIGAGSESVRAAEMDPVLVAVVQGALANAQEEMTSTLRQSGRSNVATIARDYSNAIFDAGPEMVLQGQDLPAHLGSLMPGAKGVAAYFGEDVHDGDLFYHNDPTYGGSHLTDMCAYKPVFVDGQLAFWTVSKLHVVDVGGPVAGGYNSTATEIYAEGLRIPPVRIIDRGQTRQDVLNLILLNLRASENQAGDIRAQIGACSVAAKRLQELCGKYGLSEVLRVCDHLKALADLQMRALVGEAPDGSSEATVLVEDTGHGLGDIYITAKATVTGDSLHIELSSPPQIPYYCNSYESNTVSGVFLGVVMWAQLPPPYNEGLYRSITVDCGPRGTLLNAKSPAAHMMSTSMPNENVAEAVRLALTKAHAVKSMGEWGSTYGLTFNGIDPRDDKEFVSLYVASLISGAGATKGVMDGWHMIGPGNCLGALTNGDIEVSESLYPFIIHEYELRTDSCGPGEWRGGCGVQLTFEALTDMGMATIGQGFSSAPGNTDGHTSPFPERKVAGSAVTHADGSRTDYDKIVQFRLAQGERYTHYGPGGGGAGDPFQREPGLVLRDVRDGVVSAEAARAEYGVVLIAGSQTIDEAETASVRAAHRG